MASARCVRRFFLSGLLLPRHTVLTKKRGRFLWYEERFCAENSMEINCLYETSLYGCSYAEKKRSLFVWKLIACIKKRKLFLPSVLVFRRHGLFIRLLGQRGFLKLPQAKLFDEAFLSCRSTCTTGFSSGTQVVVVACLLC